MGSFIYSNTMTTKTVATGAKQPRLTLTAPEGSNLRSLKGDDHQGCKTLEGYYLSFAPNGAKLSRKGQDQTVAVTEPGSGRVALLVGGWCHRKVEGHTPKVWHRSQASCDGGLLLVAAPGFQFEACNYRRDWRRYEVTQEGYLIEVTQAEEVLD